MATKNLVIVESPAKAKTLKKFLGSNYKIEASVGHVRDLPKSELGIDLENDYEPKYITIRGKGELLAKLRKESKKADRIYLATDPDREGEAISWHLMHALKLDETKASRITFNEITKNAVRRSIKEARAIDSNLVNAQQARRGIDRILGYKISPLLWKKVKKGLSAGRVQSVTLKLIGDREEEINNFIPTEYWTLEAVLKAGKDQVTARFYGDASGKLELKDGPQVQQLVGALQNAVYTVSEVKKGTRNKKPYPPFTTSTLQQEASKLLGFATHKTMLLAQQLYEGVEIKGEGAVGLVSYIRTDSVRIADEAYEEAMAYLTENYGKDYVSPERPVYKARARAQDAHEAIRPTYTNRTPDTLKESLSRDQYKLYTLIWERFLASQMPPAVYDTITAVITASTGEDAYTFRASGSVLRFDGYLTVYRRNETSPEEESLMPELQAEQRLALSELKDEQHFTQPPARYSEAMLVKTMEELGIGRPSTYAATISNLTYRGYVTKENKVFFMTELGEIVNDIMKNNFEDIVNIEFTAKMEEDLDKVEEGEEDWKEILRRFYPPFDEKLQLAEQIIGQVEIEDQKTDVICENCGRNMVVKYGRFGKFLACPGFPDCRSTKPYWEDAGVPCPLCGGAVQLKKTKKGRKYFGCENNPECTFMSWQKPTGEKCPRCGAYMVVKGTKEQKAACSDPECGYMKEWEAKES